MITSFWEDLALLSAYLEVGNLSGKESMTQLERQLMFAFERVTARDHPNPNRIGCPSAEKLRKIAIEGSRMTVGIIDHIGKCWPCLQELKRLRREKE